MLYKEYFRKAIQNFRNSTEYFTTKILKQLDTKKYVFDIYEYEKIGFK